MTRRSAKQITARLRKRGIPAAVAESYIGRGPTGSTCAVIVEDAQTWRSLALRVSPVLAAYNKDSLGMDIVFY